MTRLNKGAIAAFAAISLLSLGASTASANQLRSEEYPTTLSGKQSTQYKFNTKSGSFRCTTASWTGTLNAAATTAVFTPEFKGCNVSGLAAVASVNSCKYVVTSTNGSELPVGDPQPNYPATLAIDCATPGDAIVINTATCTFTLPEQGGLSATLTNSKVTVRSRNRHITAAVNASAINYSVSGYCPNIPPNETVFLSDGTMTGSSLITGTANGHAAGVYLAAKQLNAPPLFEGPGLTGTISGSSSISMSFPGIVEGVNCTSFQLSVAGQGFATEKLKMGIPQWSGCYAGGGFSVKPNGCSLELEATTSEGEDAWGVVHVRCPVGASISVPMSICTVSIPEQVYKVKVTYDTVGTAPNQKVATGLHATGIKYSGSGAMSGCEKTYENGQLNSNFDLSSSSGSLFMLY